MTGKSSSGDNEEPVRCSVCLCVQAGGASSRMGVDKALKPFCGEPLIGRVIGRLVRGALAERIQRIIVTTNHPDDYRFLVDRYDPRINLAGDILPGTGALGGLYTALMASHADLTIVVACDLPFVDADIITRGYAILNETHYDAFIPRVEAGWEPLHALYRPESCIPLIEKAIRGGQRKVSAWFSQAHILAYEVNEKEPSPFFNVNTQEEFEQAEAWAKRYDAC